MRKCCRALAPLLLVALLTHNARATTPGSWANESLLPPTPSPVSAMPESLVGTPVPMHGEPAGAPPTYSLGQQQSLTSEVLLGLPTGIRLQWGMARHQDRTFLLEAFAGFYTIAPMIGAGGRYSFTTCSSSRDALVVKPGLDVYFAINPLPALGGGPGVLVLGADVEFAWYHVWENGMQWKTGLDLGAGVALRKYGGEVPLPLAAVFTGLCF